ncbi:ATP-dependent nuclease [Diplocloster hominis]|uniref:ATP-dependent nuclease n=1 Tax=Diplocloster hominis TaxID=3079010 RepID=UPI0031BB53F0
MRTARANDYWRRTTKRDFKNYIKDIELNNYNGIKGVNIEKGIYAICGLNGAGKSTIISAIKELLGIDKNKSDLLKLENAVITGHAVINNNAIECSNTYGQQALSLGLIEENILFADYDSARIVMEFFLSQDFLDELLEQNEEIEISEEDLEEVSYLVGKEYSSIKIIEIDDISEKGTMPYFEVISHGVRYDSRKMGLGEHFLFFLFWKLKNIIDNSILILEEPETFIGIESQRHLMDYIAKIVADKGVSTIITTHSPFILENIESNHICILGRLSNSVNVTKPNINLSVNDILGGEEEIKGTFWVEDKAAELFLSILLERYASGLLRKYTIVPVGSESEITKCLKFIRDDKIHYNFVGIYDGDMKDKVPVEKLNWKYTFLPMDNNVESELKETLLCHDNNISAFCRGVNKNKEEITVILSRIDGKNYHDWFLDLCKYISCDKMLIMRELCNIWLIKHSKEVECFINELYQI